MQWWQEMPKLFFVGYSAAVAHKEKKEETWDDKGSLLKKVSRYCTLWKPHDEKDNQIYL